MSKSHTIVVCKNRMVSIDQVLPLMHVVFCSLCISDCTLDFDPLSPSSDQHQISHHHIGVQHIQVMRIKELITEDELS